MQQNLLLKERLNGLRKDRKLTLKDVEDGTGIPSQTLHRHLNCLRLRMHKASKRTFFD